MPERLPPDYIDSEHTGHDREMLEEFYRACRSEGGSADEIHLRGLKAVIALAQPEPEGVEDRIVKLEADLERERLRLAACSVVALADTPESAAKARDMLPEYHSASLADVIRQIDALMELRATLKSQAPTDKELEPEPEELTDEELEAIAGAAEIQYIKEHGGLTASTPDGIDAQLRAQRIAGLRAVAARCGRPTTTQEES